MSVINSTLIDLYLQGPGDRTVEKLTQGFVNFHLDPVDLFSKRFVEVNDFVLHMYSFFGFLTK